MKKYKKISCSEFGRRLMRVRPIIEDMKLGTPLERCLNYPQLTLYCVAHMIGAGLYVLTGQLIRDYAGPATSVAYFMSALPAMFTAMCYAEFSTLFPRAGSAYLYTYLMFGELPAFLIGWTMVSDVIVSTAAISKAFSGTINRLSNNTIRIWSTQNLLPLGSSTISDPVPDLIAAGFILFLMFLTLTGANISLTINAFLSTIQILSLIIIIIACFVLGSVENYTDFGGFFPYGVGGLLRGAGLSVFAFSGFENLANASEEAKNPRRDLPLALFTALAICTTLYLGASLGLAYLVPPTAIVYDSPFMAAFDYVGQTGLMAFAAFATLLATGATKLVAMYVIPRYFYSIASDGLLFGFLTYVEPRTKVPIWSLLLGGCICILLATFIKIQILAEFTSVGIIFSYFIIGLDLMILRYLFRDEYNVIHPIEDSDDDKIENDKEPDQNILLPSSNLWLRGCTPACLKGLETRNMFKGILAVYIGAVIGAGIFLNLNLDLHLELLWVACGTCALIAIVAFTLLCFYEPMKNGKGFETPWMPLAPGITMLSNGILLTTMAPLTWLRFVIWSAIGLLIYFAYGIWYSKADDVSEEIQ